MKGDRIKLRLVHHWSIDPENTKNAANMAQKMTPNITPWNIISNEISPQTKIAKYLAVRNTLRMTPSDRNLHKDSKTKLGGKVNFYKHRIERFIWRNSQGIRSKQWGFVWIQLGSQSRKHFIWANGDNHPQAPASDVS
ncbi:hypothetical protein SH467x_002473 [Pirellulaceae bacterium SH467]